MRTSLLTLEQRRAIADRLFMLRSDRGWTQKELARRAHMPKCSISKYECVTKGIGRRTIARLAKALGVRQAAIYGVEQTTEGAA